VLLVGNPNSGKTTLFNLLTGLSQKIANYPGVTVESKSGMAKLYDAKSSRWDKVEIVDLPGIYSLEPISEDEREAVDPIRFYEKHPEKENILVLFVLDMGNPQRSLHLFFALKDLGFKMALLLNMAYMAKEKGIEPNLSIIQADLGNIPAGKKMVYHIFRKSAQLHHFPQHTGKFYLPFLTVRRYFITEFYPCFQMRRLMHERHQKSDGV
jgi:Fe2+ transport system protein B